jgi:Flp pilus assembly protein TadG
LSVRRSGASKGRGQSLAEFALVVPVFLLILFGIIQFGMIFWGQNTLNQVVRDTGRWAASQQACDSAAETAVIGTANSVAAASSLIGYSKSAPWTASDVSVTFTGSPCPPTSNQTTAWVNITIRHSVPVFFPFLPGNGQISSSTQFRMEPTPK